MKKKMMITGILVFSLVSLGAGSAIATKPGQDVNPNGFPSGEHYNLNIIGKKDGFTCPEPDVDEFGDPVYGNVVFVPQNGTDIEVIMQSGKGEKAETITELQVIDPCTAAFDGDAAVLQLPKNDKGYRVYARALATPTDSPDLTITPELVLVEDESGNNLIYLGLVTDNGFETPLVTFTRNKGKSKSVDITGLFEWTGQVCYFEEPLAYDSVLTKCCLDTDLDGIYDNCLDQILVDGVLTCPDGYDELTVFCTDYQDEWVFNIGDFVEYLWDMDNNGLKLLQVRFYPVQ